MRAVRTVMADLAALSAVSVATPIVRATAGPNRPIVDGHGGGDDPLGAIAR